MANRISVLVALEGADEGLKRAVDSAEKSLGELSGSANCHDPCGSPWMMEDTGGVRASAGRGRSIL